MKKFYASYVIETLGPEGVVSELELESYSKCLSWLIDNLFSDEEDGSEWEDPEDIVDLENLLRSKERNSCGEVMIISIIEEGVGLRYEWESE
jgi:hypothetical protein